MQDDKTQELTSLQANLSLIFYQAFHNQCFAFIVNGMNAYCRVRMHLSKAFNFFRLALFAGVASATLIVCSDSHAEEVWDIQLSEQELKSIADATLTLMAFTVLPDITTSSLSIDSAAADNPGIWQSTFGGGFTIGTDYPLYVEGSLGYSRYDPDFIATQGQEQRLIPLKWNSFSATGGIGWDFPLTSNKELKLRPIFNFTLGYVTTDVALGQDFLNLAYDLDLNAIDDGRMTAYGLGGSLALDYKHYVEQYEIDLELRHTYIQLQSFGGTSDILKGNSETNAASLWARWRAPTDVVVLQRPLRYVLESSVTSFFGPQRGALGFKSLASVGAGLELDTSAYTAIISRARLVGRYIFGDNVSGFSVGIAASF